MASIAPLSANDTPALRVELLAPALGAVVRGIDLAAEHSDATIVAIRALLDEYLVLFFEDQELTSERQFAFARRFGNLHIHPLYPGETGLPEIIKLEYDESRKGHNNVWHSDVSFIETPPQASILYAEELPELGGDTIWINSYLAYEALSLPLQRLASKLRAIHDFSQAFQPERFAEYGIAERTSKAYEENPPVSHPLVRTNPATGRKALYVNQNFTVRIAGVSKLESDALLKLFLDHLLRPEFQVRWRWKPRAVACWENRWTQHYALSDYFPQRRRMRRATILGERPI